MGTVPLIESISDVRNLGTLAAYLIIGTLVWISLTNDNRQKAGVIIMVSICRHIIWSHINMVKIQFVYFRRASH